MTSYVTTKQGDQGRTTALDGSQLEKDHVLMEAVGTLDTLRAQTALLRLHLLEGAHAFQREADFLSFVLHACFIMGSAVSDPANQRRQWRHGEITEQHLAVLEQEQARLEASLTLPRAFIACATTLPAAQADLTASMTRAFERRLVAFARQTPCFEAAHYLAFVNRLSDYFFILARYLEQGRHEPVNYDAFTLAISQPK